MTVEVEEDTLLQAVAALKADARGGYTTNNTTYADFRHGTARKLAESLEQDWTDIPDAVTGHDLE